jgi:predicted nucleic acid-binding protein
MQRTWKFLHVAGVATLIGSLVAVIALAAFAAKGGADMPALRAAMAWILWRVSVPAVLLAWVTGMLSMMARPAYLEARWVWAKLVAGSIAAATVLVIAAPAADLATDLARRAASGQPVADALAAATAREALWTWVTAIAGLCAMALGVWRPRLGGD